MSEDIINIQVTEAEGDLLMGLLHDRAEELLEKHSISGDMETAARADQILELADDLREQTCRGDWRNDAVPDAAMQMVQAGTNAREHAKDRSQQQEVDVWQIAVDAEINAENEKLVKLMQGTASPVDADFMNDPLNW
jgi:hypothetical protein